MTSKLVLEGIHVLHSIDPSQPDAFERAIEAYKHMGKIPLIILDFPDLPKHIFHTRTHDTDNFFESFKDISIPPAHVVNSFARCNIPNQPVFYCSDYRPTSYMELLEYWLEEKTDEFLYVTIGKWKVENSLKVVIISSPHSEERISNYDQMHGKSIDRFLSMQNEEMRAALVLFYKFLFDKFRKPAKKDPLTYIMTSAYCYLTFDQGQDSIDAILYPSVPYEGKGVNIAIKQTYQFKQNMTLVLAGRDTFKRTEHSSIASFQQVDHREATAIDYEKEIIYW